jgi:hypothetical protein
MRRHMHTKIVATMANRSTEIASTADTPISGAKFSNSSESIVSPVFSETNEIPYKFVDPSIENNLLSRFL